jgi:diguanylate cyclase (GGDEF)-like protein
MFALRQARLLSLVVALLVGSAVWIASAIQSRAADDARTQQSRAQQLLTSMLDMETAVRGFQLTGDEPFAAPFTDGRRRYDAAVLALRADTDGAIHDDVVRADDAARRWQTLGDRVIAEVRRLGKHGVMGAEMRKNIFDEFRAAQARLVRDLDAAREDAATVSAYVAGGISLILALVLAFLVDLFVGRPARADRERRRAEARYRETQSEFVETLQLADDESDAHELLRRHLERSVPDAQVVVLNRNNSDDRLIPATEVADPALAERLEGAQPKACLAVRLGRESHREPAETPLLNCDVCGGTAGAATCKPLIVGSEVIGSVLVTHHRPLGDADRERLRDSVAQAAPTLANLRNLALAETRAATDSLTGLPNRRSIEDTLKRMIAQASRTAVPLSALMIDLDHFKTINDLYGHESGDDALAALGTLLSDSLRQSDFAGRQGGEEFIVLAPATDPVGAATLAENLRAAIESLQVPALDHRLTASIGVATFPDVASGATGLVRMADRALYTAKENGRNRVEIASGPAASRAGGVES